MPGRFLEPALGDGGKWGAVTHKYPKGVLPAAGNRRSLPVQRARTLGFSRPTKPPHRATLLQGVRGELWHLHSGFKKPGSSQVWAIFFFLLFLCASSPSDRSLLMPFDSICVILLSKSLLLVSKNLKCALFPWFFFFLFLNISVKGHTRPLTSP